MDLIVFDLDGTLLDASSRISSFTRDTLALLAERDVLYTVATGRALHAARDLIADHGFRLPQAYKNGVLIWHPDTSNYSRHAFLTNAEIRHIVDAVLEQGVTPFLSTLEPGDVHGIYHTPLRSSAERQLAAEFRSRGEVVLRPASEMPADAEITSISALGPAPAIQAAEALVADEAHLVAYAGMALEGGALMWIDIHHVDGSKGGAVEVLKRELGVSRVLCFGDGDNDLSMFAVADEAYAPANAGVAVRAAATAVIGHHDEDGIARFLRERFSL